MPGWWRWIMSAICLALVLQAATAAEDAATVVLRQPGDPGERLFLTGRVVDGNGRALAGAVVRIRHTDDAGVYHSDRFRARVETAGDGTFKVDTILPGTPSTYGGPRHIHIDVSRDDYPGQATRIVFKGDPELDRARTSDLPIMLEEAHQDGNKVFVGDVEVVLGAGSGN